MTILRAFHGPRAALFYVLLGASSVHAQGGSPEPSAPTEGSGPAKVPAGESVVSVGEKSTAPKPGARASALAVRVTLRKTALREDAIVKALANEFRVPVVAAQGSQGLQLTIDGRSLHASYRDEEGQVIERRLELPRDSEAQVETIALLSGNLARDEAGELLAELRAEEDESATLPTPPVPSPLTETDAEESATTDADGAPEESAGEEPPKPAPQPPEEKAKSQEEGEESPAPQDPSPAREKLQVAEMSAALWGNVTYPKGLDRMKTNVHIGAVHSEIGSLDGVAGNLILMRNLGRGQDYAGQGAQIALVYSETGGHFTGFNGAAIATWGTGGILGAQAAAIFSFQKNETEGAQLAGVASLSMSHVEGAQLAGTVAGTWGNIEGVQGSGGLALTTGNLHGLQVAPASITGGKLDGVQLGVGTFAAELDGFQMGAVNIAHQKMEGLQLGAGNYAGDFNGTQIGLVNIGGRVKGAQFGLVNIAKDVDGMAFAPVNIIPGIRNQLVTYGSWSPAASTEASPAGPLLHLGVKFMPEPFYTQLSLGLGAEAEECPSGTLPGDAACVGNGVLYAPGFAFGVRGKIVAGLFTELDVQYQFEKAFSSSVAQRHAVLGRAALGYEFNKKFALVAGGGPRMDAHVAGDGTLEPQVTWNPHVFAGVQAF